MNVLDMLDIKENELLKNHSTFRIGGPARYFVVAKNKEEVLEAINFAKEKKLPYFIFGGGSNILFRDEGYEGVVIKIRSTKFEIRNNKIIAESGILLSQLVSFAIENNLSGLEWAIGIPGTIGGCVAGNCGAFGKSISENIVKVKTLDKEYDREQCGFEYRESRFKKPSSPEIILEIELELKKGNPEEIKKRIKNNLLQRKDRIPPFPSAGCVFKNPKPLSAGKLIDECGLRGEKINNAQISENHANIIVNLGGAKAEDVLELIKICKEKVREKFKVDLEEEIVII
jgi:UDP-N-acetylmuramate dehydrogenase